MNRDKVYFVQDHRFDIYEGVGCAMSAPNSIPLVFLYTAWPIPIGLASAIYCSESGVLPFRFLVIICNAQSSPFALF